MKSFQLRVTAWIAIALFALMFVTLVAFNVYAIHGVLHHAKKNMKTLSRTVLARIREAEGNGESIGPEVFRRIDDGLEVLDPNGPMAYALFTKEGKLIHQTADYEQLASRDLLAGPPETLMIRSVKSPGNATDLLSEWHVMLRNRGGDYVVLVSDREDYEAVEHFAIGFMAVVLLAGVLAVPCGYFLSRRILVPLATIQETTQRVREGDFEARVPVPRADDEIAQLARDLNQTFADLSSLLDGMRRFCADAAHELKTPLTALRGNLEVCLAKSRTAEEYQQVLGEGVAEIASLSAMIHDLLLVSVSGDRRQTASFRPVAPGPLFREVLEHLSAAAAERGVGFQEDLDDNLLIAGDEALLPRVCYNLVDNAVRYAPTGSAVVVRWERSGDHAVLTVSDRGKGIPLAEQERIFERFHQIDESRNRGTGLGLAIVKWIAELHDGTVSVQSTPPHGAIFRVVFPVSVD